MIDISNLEIIKGRINSEIASRHFSSALEQLDSMAQVAGVPWEMRREVSRLKESYGYLRRYALDGTDDPSRERMLADISSGILSTASAIMRHSQIEASPKQYFGVLRYEKMQSDSSIPGLIGSFMKVNDELSMASLTGVQQSSAEARRIRQEHDSLNRRLFDLVWVTYPLSSEDAVALKDFLNNDNIRIEYREHIISAIMLGAMTYYDERRMVLLAETYLRGEKRIEVKALVALTIAMWMQRNALTGHRFAAVMDTVREHKGWTEDLKMVFLNLVRTRDADRISRTMTEEVIPKMMKLRPEILKKINETENPDELANIEDNPEWEDLIEKSGVADKLKYLNDLQTEGGDVMLSTFAGLKSFPFFNNAANWFLPFFTDQTDVMDILNESAADLGEMIDMNPMICDSDKFSMVFSLERIPAANRRMMLEQFKMQNVNLAELRNTLLNPELTSRNNVANHFIQDLYRFFTLYRRKGEFLNPFGTPINLASVEMLSSDLSDSMSLEAVAEFYFKHGYYSEALDVFMLLLKGRQANSALFQKAGYCRQQLGDITGALDFYHKAELMSPDSLWIMRRIAQCLRLLGRHEEALPYYRRLSEAKPSDVGIALNLGHCYLASGNCDEALKCYFKVEYMDEKSHKALRPIAWSLFLTGDFVRAEKYYAKIMADSPNATDYLNCGHLYLALKQYDKAAECYGAFLKEKGGDLSRLDAEVEADLTVLEKAGIDPTMIALVVDAAQYPENNR